MREFTDGTGKIWKISITIGSIIRVKSKLGVDLLQIEQGKPPLISRLWQEELLMAEILACLMGEQLSDKSDAEIYEAFDGATLIKATNAFYEELSDFFRKSARTERAEIVDKQRELVKKGIAMLTEQVQKIDTSEMLYGILSGDAPDKLE